MPNEETGITPPTTPVVEGSPQPPAAPAAPAQDAPPVEAAPPAPDAGPKGWDAWDAWREKNAPGAAEDIEQVVSAYTPETFDRMEETERVRLFGLHQRYEAMEAARKAEIEADRAKLAKEREALKAEQVRFKQRERAFMEELASAKPPGELPADIDPFTKEGQAALARQAAEKAAYEREAPLRTKLTWAKLTEEYPDLNKRDVFAEFEAYLTKANEGVDLTKERPRLTTQAAVVEFFKARELAEAKRELEALRAAAAAEAKTRNVERARAATHVGTSSGTGIPDPLAAYDQIKKTRGTEAARDYLDTHPEAEAAWLRRYGGGEASA